MQRADPVSRRARRIAAAVRRPLELLGRGLLDLRITGREHLPEPPYVAAANHFSFIDPVLVSVAAERSVRYLAVRGIFERSPTFARLITVLGAIPLPLDRTPMAAVRTALAELESGHPVGVFPEGRRVLHWRETSPRHGAAWLGFAAGVPVVPVAIKGSEGTLSLSNPGVRRTAVRVWIEPPIDPLAHLDRTDPVGAVTAAWVSAVGRRLDPWYPDALGTDSTLADDAG